MPNFFENEKIGRRNVLRGMAATVAAAGFAHPSSGQGRRQLTSTINGGDTGARINEIIWRPLIEAYDFDFVPVAIRGSETLARMIAEHSAPEIDIYGFFNGHHVIAEDRDLLYKPLDLGPVINDIGEYYKAQDRSWVATNITVQGIIYNKDKMEAPTSLEDFFRPEYQGHIGLPGLSFAGQQFLAMMSKLGGGDERNFQPGIDNIRRFSAEAPIATGGASLPGMFDQQDIWMIWYDLSNAYRLKQLGLPVEFAYVEQGAPMLKQAYSITKNSPNVDLAEKALAYMLEPEVQVQIAREMLWLPTNQNAVLPDEVAALVPPSDLLLELDEIAMYETYQAYQRAWNREIAV